MIGQVERAPKAINLTLPFALRRRLQIFGRLSHRLSGRLHGDGVGELRSLVRNTALPLLGFAVPGEDALALSVARILELLPRSFVGLRIELKRDKVAIAVRRHGDALDRHHGIFRFRRRLSGWLWRGHRRLES